MYCRNISHCKEGKQQRIFFRTPEIIIRPVLTTIIHSTYPEVTPEPTQTEVKTTFRQPPETTSSPRHVTTSYDQYPTVSHPTGKLECERGTVCVHKINKNTFHDAEDGNTFNLRLSLKPLVSGGDLECFLSRSQRHLTCFSMIQGKKGTVYDWNKI